MSYGLGEYVEFFPCPYPEVVDQFNQVPPPVLIANGDPCACGMGVFDAGLNFDQWGVAEWATVAVGAYLAISLFQDSTRAASRVRRFSRRRAA